MLWHTGWKIKAHALKLVPKIHIYVTLTNSRAGGMGGSALAFTGIDVQRVFALRVIFSWFFLVSSLDYSDSPLLVLWCVLCLAVSLVWILRLIPVLTLAVGRSKWWMGILLMGDNSFQNHLKKWVSWSCLGIFGIDISPDIESEKE